MQQLAGIAPREQSLILASSEIENGATQQAWRFKRKHRLVKRDVVELLRGGVRFSRSELMIKINGNSAHGGRLAVAVPKRILKSAVERNTVKRLIREEFRIHEARAAPVDMLVTLCSAAASRPGSRATDKSGRRVLRKTFTRLLTQVAQRFALHD